MKQRTRLHQQAERLKLCLFRRSRPRYLLPNEAKISSSLRERNRISGQFVALQFRYRMRARLDSLEVERSSVTEKPMVSIAWSLQTVPDKGPFASNPCGF